MTKKKKYCVIFFFKQNSTQFKALYHSKFFDTMVFILPEGVQIKSRTKSKRQNKTFSSRIVSQNRLKTSDVIGGSRWKQAGQNEM